ncbi:MAG: PIN domain-containing protein [Candidatus Kuenenbacteria bacterium]
MVVLDTNIIIDHLRQSLNKISFLRRIEDKINRENLAISIISIQELYEGKSTQYKNQEQYLLATISPLKILPYTYETAQLAGEIARDLKQNIELADAAIAATAIINGASLITLNKKHFLNINHLQLQDIELE